MRMLKFLFLIAIVNALLCACHASVVQGEMGLGNADNTSTTENTVPSYTNDTLDRIALHNSTMDALLAQYPTEYIQKLDNCYRVVYYGDSAIAVVLFELDGTSPISRIYKTAQPKSAYDGLSIGQTLDHVRAMDPDGEYLFLYTGRNDYPKYSTHYTTDKYVVCIKYSNDYLITQINIEQINSVE